MGVRVASLTFLNQFQPKSITNAVAGKNPDRIRVKTSFVKIKMDLKILNRYFVPSKKAEVRGPSRFMKRHGATFICGICDPIS